MVVLWAWLLADFLTGIVHWVEDKLFAKTTMHVFQSIEADNDLHHEKPAAMIAYSYWQNINTGAVIAWPIALILFVVGAPTVWTLAVFFGSFANLVHRFAHMPKAKVPRVVRWFQMTGLFITFDHHWQHHFDEGLLSKDQAYRRYCPMTNWLNPVLDRIKFFQFLTYLFKGK